MKRVLLCFFICLCLGGCSKKIEISRLGVVAGVGIDKTETGYLMTAQVINPTSVAGNHHDTLPIITIQAEGSTIYESYSRLANLTSKVLYIPHLSVIVIDENIARDGINDVLDLALRDVEIRPNITLMVSKDEMASTVLSTLSPNEEIPIIQLNTLNNMCPDCTGRQVEYNLYDVINMLNGKGTELVLNSVQLKGNDLNEGEDISNILESNSPVQLEVSYLSVFQDDKMVGYLDSHEAIYYNVLMDNVKRYIITAKRDNQYNIVFEARNTKTDIKPDIDNRKVSIKCEVSGYIMENQYPIDLTKPDNINMVETYIAEAMKDNLSQLITKTQTELKSDIIGIGSKIHMKEPKKWAKVQGYWQEIYPTLTFDVEVKINIISVEDVQNLQKQEKEA